MRERETPFDPDVLFAEIAWLRRLAASLVGSVDRADDVVQDVLVAAIEHRPDGRVRGSLRPWLRAVAKKLVLRGARRAASRASVEHRSARA